MPAEKAALRETRRKEGLPGGTLRRTSIGSKRGKEGGKIERRRRLHVRAAPRKTRIEENGLDCFRRGSPDGSVRALGKRVVWGILLGALVDFDRAFEVGAVFNHDPGGG